MIVEYSKELYSKATLLKAAYYFTDRAYIHIDANAEKYIVEFTSKDGCDAVSYREFDNEMLTQAVRNEIFNQTKVIRELTVSRALASTVINTPSNEESAATSPDFSNILDDWFEKNE